MGLVIESRASPDITEETMPEVRGEGWVAPAEMGSIVLVVLDPVRGEAPHSAVVHPRHDPVSDGRLCGDLRLLAAVEPTHLGTSSSQDILHTFFPALLFDCEGMRISGLIRYRHHKYMSLMIATAEI